MSSESKISARAAWGKLERAGKKIWSSQQTQSWEEKCVWSFSGALGTSQGLWIHEFPFPVRWRLWSALIASVNLSQSPSGSRYDVFRYPPAGRGSWEACAILWPKQHLHLRPRSAERKGVAGAGPGLRSEGITSCRVSLSLSPSLGKTSGYRGGWDPWPV